MEIAKGIITVVAMPFAAVWFVASFLYEALSETCLDMYYVAYDALWNRK